MKLTRGPKQYSGRRWYAFYIGPYCVSFGRWFVAWKD